MNVGAGTGNYEPSDRMVVAVDPSRTMLTQRAHGAAPAVLGVAEALPFADATFDVALAILTVHHWPDLERGLSELRRVAPRQVLFCFDVATVHELWLYEYFPEIAKIETERTAPDTAQIAQHLHVVRIDPVPIPADCVDGFGGCYWNRPEAYLDRTVQEGMSCLAQLDKDARARGTERLRHDLASGVWDARHGHLRTMGECDIGYRVLTAGLPS
ncbi:MAG: class I SAM-dependent methyltransferase [Actinomycetota bacterium]